MRSRLWHARNLLAFPLLSAMSWLIARVPARQPRHGVLVLRLDATGDFFIWYQSGMREVLRHARTLGQPVVLLARHDWAELARAEGLADEVLAIDTQRFCTRPGYRLRWLWRLRRRGFDVIIEPRCAREIWIEDWIVLAVGARSSIGPQGLELNLPAPLKRITDRWYTRLLPTLPYGAHETERNAAFASALSGGDVRRQTYRTDVSLLKPFALPAAYFVLAPGSAVASKRWPAERFAEAARRILEAGKLDCVLVGTVNECDLCRDLLAALPAGRAIDLSARTTLAEMAAIVGLARFVLGNDSGACHVAAAQDIPAVTVLGGGHFGEFLPYPANGGPPRQIPVFKHMDCYHCNWECVFDVAADAPYPCIDGVSTNAMVAALARLGLPGAEGLGQPASRIGADAAAAAG